MSKAADVLLMLMPNGGYTSIGEDYEGIIFLDPNNKITKEEYLAGFDTVDAWFAEQAAAKQAARQAVLDRLGLTKEEVQLITEGSN
jgi:hypothetical protein